MDVVAHQVRRDGQLVALGPTEFRLLKFFLEHPGRVFSREQLLDAVWAHDSDIEMRTVDVHIRRLRKALNARQPSRPYPHRPLSRHDGEDQIMKSKFFAALLAGSTICFIATPASAQSDEQLWTNFNATVKLERPLAPVGGRHLRFSDNRKGLYELEANTLLGYRLEQGP